MAPPLIPLRTRIERLASPEPNTGCWLWLGNYHPTYGRPRLRAPGGKSMLAHILSYRAYRGEIPTGLTLDHRCNNIACVNPEHLEPVTRGENTARAARLRYNPNCKHGHGPKTQRIVQNGHPEVRCAMCHTIAERAYRERNRV